RRWGGRRRATGDHRLMSTSVHQLLSELAQLGIKLSAEGEQLRLRNPKGALSPELRDRIVEQKESILALLRKGSTEEPVAGWAPIAPAPQDRHLPCPLTDIQAAYWLGRTAAFMIPCGIHMYREYDCTDLDIPRLNRSWRRVVARHDMLRAHTLPNMMQVI